MSAFPETQVCPDTPTLARDLADSVQTAARDALAARGTFHLVLAGGNTPRALYAELARRGAGDAQWHIWYGDERCLPADHPERNSVMAESAWLGASAIPPGQRHAIPAEFGAAAAASQYETALAAVGEFDLVLLGLGEDGHTASLFPDDTVALYNHDEFSVLAIHHAPKPPPERVSLSVQRLARSREVSFIATGAGKRDALARWRAGEAIPAARVSGRLATRLWLDTAAATSAATAS
jgi:6-phosphogluconolactonase